MLTSFRRKPASGSVAMFPSFPPPNRHSGARRNPAALQSSRHSRPQTVIPAKAGIRQRCKVPVIPAPKPSFRRKPESGSLAMFPSFPPPNRHSGESRNPVALQCSRHSGTRRHRAALQSSRHSGESRHPAALQSSRHSGESRNPSALQCSRHSGESRNPGAAR